MATEVEQTTLYLVGFGFPLLCGGRKAYTIYVNDDRPIMRDQRPIIFSELSLATLALQQSNCGAAALATPTSVYAEFDFQDALETLRTKSKADSGAVLDCINILLDFVNCIDVPMPPTFRNSLEKLADHLTFDLRLKKLFSTDNPSRQDVVNSIYWAFGTVASNSLLITSACDEWRTD